MKPNQWPFLLFLSLTCAQLSWGNVHQTMPFRHLKAASKNSDLLRRSDTVDIGFSAEFSYAQSESYHGWAGTFASRVKTLSDRPIVAVEDIEHLIDSIKCSPSSINLAFKTAAAHSAVMEACSHPKGVYVVTSHAGCNDDDERAVFETLRVDATPEDFGLEMYGSRVSFEDAFRSMKVQFGHTSESHTFRSSELRRRQILGSEFGPEESPSVSVSAKTLDLVPSGSPAATDASYNLSSQLVNQQIQIPSIIAVGLPIPFSCDNCSTFGTLDVTEGDFDIDLKNALHDSDGLGFINDGFVRLAAQGLGAHVELSASPSSSGSFNIPLPTIPFPVVGFSIPGIGKAGLTFSPNISLSYNVNGGVEISFGFEAQVPDNSSIAINFSNFSQSSVQGFQHMRVNTLPVSANESSLSLALSAAFIPKISFGFEFDSGAAKADADVFANIPTLQATFSELSNVDEHCNPFNSSTSTLKNETTTDIDQSALQSIIASLGKFTLVDAEAILALGVEAQASIAKLRALNLAASTTLLATTFQLPTTCFAFQPSATAFVPASEALSSATSSYLSSVSAASAAEASKTGAIFAPTGTSPSKPQSTSGGKALTPMMKLCFGALALVAAHFILL